MTTKLWKIVEVTGTGAGIDRGYFEFRVAAERARDNWMAQPELAGRRFEVRPNDGSSISNAAPDPFAGIVDVETNDGWDA